MPITSTSLPAERRFIAGSRQELQIGLTKPFTGLPTEVLPLGNLRSESCLQILPQADVPMPIHHTVSPGSSGAVTNSRNCTGRGPNIATKPLKTL